jgi:hypothetical protein
LNAEPGWRRICDVRSNGERWKFVPPTSARTPPVAGSMERIATCSGSLFDWLRIHE